MRTRLLTVSLLTVCLATIGWTASVADSEYAEEYDLPSNRTLDDYDENGDLITTTTQDDSLIETDSDADAKEIVPSDAEPTEEIKTKSSPGNIDENDCGEPPSIENGRIERGKKSLYSAGDVVHYSCEFGYATDGFERTAQCHLSEITDTLVWRRPKIVCVPRSCGDPGYVANGQRIGSVFTFPNKVTYECDEGYRLQGGNGHRYCTTTATWSGQLPTCEKMFCEPPLSPTNGRVSFDSLEFGSVLRYECEEGFLLRNHNTRSCAANGTWSGDEPLCIEAQCEPPVSPDYGSVQLVGGKSSVGSRAIYTCDGDRFLVGSPTSKCLDIGQWTFPTPKCLEACSVPEVPHGQIGKYVKIYRRSTFKKLNTGDKIEDGSDLYLTCDEKYEPFGTTNTEEKIVCSHGEWSGYPRCDPAECRAHPPPTPNAHRSNSNNSHGAGVVYLCNRHFTKIAYGNVKCQFGTWIGKTPKCKDTRCDAWNVAFTGVKKDEGKRYYGHTEKYTPVCEEGYSSSKTDNRLICLSQEWKGHLPPCEPANCSSDPPAVENGRALPNFSRLHTSEVSYECKEHFLLKSSDSRVKCNFGEWTGSPPKCQDLRCNAKDLKKKSGVSTDTETITSNGDSLKFECEEGFSATGHEPRCTNGEWHEPHPPCKENDCSTYNLNQGKFTEKVRMRGCNYIGLNCKYWDGFNEVKRTRIFSPGSSIFVSCDNGLSLHGKGVQNAPVECSRGQWQPSPVCLRNGMPYQEEIDAAPRRKTHLDASAHQPTTKPLSATAQPPVVTAPVAEIRPANCSCLYRHSDPNLVGFAGLERLRSGTGIKDGCKVRFHCSPLGYYRLNGVRELVCEGCRTWHSSEYPECVLPQSGVPVIKIESNRAYVEMASGVLGIHLGSALRLTCTSTNALEYPNWELTHKEENTIVYVMDTVEMGYPRKNRVLEIHNINSKQTGTYDCTANRFRNSLDVQVIMPEVACPIIGEDKDFTVQYDKGQSFNSSAIFSCKNSNARLIGPSVLTCLINGQWSGDPPQCVTMCSKLPETGGLKVFYSSEQLVDSQATFHCLLPLKRTGVAHTTCNGEGRWTDPIPTCEMSSCSVAQLYDEIPENVVPVLDESVGEAVAYNSSLRLKCTNGGRLTGGADAARCGREGKWEVDRVQCGKPGCPPVEKSDDILLDPDEEFYRVGQFVTFTCAPGQVLSSEVVRMMCLGGESGAQWSLSEMPTCVTASAEETS